MAKGRHAKSVQSTTTTQRIAAISTVLIGGSVIPVAFAGTANAATAAEWDRVAQCESGGRWDLSWGDADSTGGLQIQDRTWADYGGTAIAPHAYQATKAQQIAVAEKILATQGSRAWSVTWNGTCPGATLSSTPYNAPTPPPAATPSPAVPVAASVAGLPKPNAATPSAVPLQRELKRVGYMPAAVKENANYGPRTQDSVARFHNDHPEYRWIGVPHDVTIGPKGWAHLKSMKSKAASPAPASAPSSSGAFVMPVHGTLGDGLINNGGCVSRTCGGHSGQDIIAPSGTPVHAASAGVVSNIGGAGAAYGNHIVIRHASGLFTLYAHLSAIKVSVGQSVSAGQQIGNVGSTGTSSGPHLHFEVRTDPTAFSAGIFLSPVTWLRSHGVTI